ncbi:MAG TPA: SDR family NAD(P)-dependent oxidoreductase [Actinomycetes bacterium]|nr:SDR family NAD(P)-dependent oxidoreductase [Actinomycetes bacterium]
MAPPCLVSARDADHARAAAEELSAGGDVRALKVGLQVTDDASVRAAAQALEDDPGRVDVLVNNAADVDWSETAPAPTWPPPTRSWRSTCSAPGGSPTPCCRCWGEATIPGW